MRPRQYGFGMAGAILLAAILAACGGGGGGDDGEGDDGGNGGETPAGDTPGATATAPPVATATPTPAGYQGPKPAPGTGALSGRVLWNGEPVSGATVQLCGDVGFLTGCESPGASVSTGADGVYILTDVPPGEYALIAQLPGEGDWVYVTTGFMSARKYTIVGDEAADIGDFNTIRFDLALLSPPDDATLSESAVTLSWQSYEGAAYYEVYLHPQLGATVFPSERVEGTTITTETTLRDCQYNWSVEAYNADGMQIAEAQRHNHFTLTGQATSCKVTLASPVDDATIAAQGTELSWQAHPEAAYYLLYVTNETTSEQVYAGTRVNGTAYTMTAILGPGEYSWYVAVYESGDEWIGASDWWAFRVP